MLYFLIFPVCLLTVTIKLQFEKMGQWAARHTVWLDMRVKSDGEFKNLSFKIIGNIIVSIRIHGLIYSNLHSFMFTSL